MTNGLKAGTQITGGAVRRSSWTRRVVAAGVMALSLAAGTGAASALIVYDTPDLGLPTLPGPTVVSGATFYSDGASVRTGPSGALVSLFATSAEPGFGYKLVSGRAGGGTPCSSDVMAINDAVRSATSDGYVAQTAGNLNRSPGEWQICFLAQGHTVTAAVTYTVTG